MNIPSQFTIRDLTVYLFFGIGCFLVTSFYFWNIWGINLFIEINRLGLLGVFTLLFVSVILGELFSNAYWGLLDRLCFASTERPLNKVPRFLTRVLLGISPEVDVRIQPFLMQNIVHQRIVDRIQNMLFVDFDKQKETVRREIFYLIMRFNEQNMSANIVMPERNHVKANFYSGYITLLSVSSLANAVSVYLKVQMNVGYVNAQMLLIIQVVLLLSLRYLVKHFQRRVNLWRVDTWRIFLAIGL